MNLLGMGRSGRLVCGRVRRGAPVLQDNTALVLDLKGPLVEELSGGVRDNARAQLRGN